MTKYVFPLPCAEALLFLNGVKSPLDDEHLKRPSLYQFIIATDGAWNDLSSSPLAEDIDTVIGDGDSITQPTNRWISATDQNRTDGEKALRYLIDKGIKTVDIFWASGGETDHFLGNLSLAVKYRKAITCRFFDHRQVYFFATGDHSITGAEGKTLSIYPFPKAQVSSNGLAYELSHYVMNQHKSHSLRNEITAKTVTLSIDGDVFIFIER